jgi:beta-N-acetylhexosaminidase
MIRFGREIPTLMVSFGHPYYLYDAPDVATYINAYAAIAPVQKALARKLSGEAFTGISPVDAFCGLEQARY